MRIILADWWQSIKTPIRWADTW